VLTLQRNPYKSEKEFSENKGEFSVYTEQAFEKHLARLFKAVIEIKKSIGEEEMRKISYKEFMQLVYLHNPLWY
jgi:hypothetical protein